MFEVSTEHYSCFLFGEQSNASFFELLMKLGMLHIYI